MKANTNKHKYYSNSLNHKNHLPTIPFNPLSLFDNQIQFYIEDENYSKAGYLLLFGHMSRSYSDNVWDPIADVNVRKKYLNSIRSPQAEKEQNETYWSGPTNFNKSKSYRKEKDDFHYFIKADLNSAYPNYLLTVKRPGVQKKRYDGFHPVGNGEIVSYRCNFFTEKGSNFHNWFVINDEKNLRSRKVEINGDFVRGEILIFSSKEMPLLEYAYQFAEGLEVICSYVHTGEPLNVDLDNVRNLVIEKNHLDNDHAKAIVNQATGWMSRIDKASYYHMVQYVKFQLLDFVMKHDILDDTLAVVTDSLLIQVTEQNVDKLFNNYKNVFDELVNYSPPNEVYYDIGVPLGCGRFARKLNEYRYEDDVEVVTAEELEKGYKVTGRELKKILGVS